MPCARRKRPKHFPALPTPNPRVYRSGPYRLRTGRMGYTREGNPQEKDARTRGQKREGQTPMQKTKAKAKQDRKRILSVTLKRMVDDSPDTSYLGEYSSRAESDDAIDRAHSLECRSVNTIREDYLYTHDGDGEAPRRCTYCDATETEALTTPCTEYDFGDDCDCNGGDMERNEYRYFNGCVENYKGLP